uniref:protein MIZU-KUSSEI 1-like n=1 Tax=Erigeron canadensis TaxID=72917 RepID=UPI001CB940D5|nr:protein MIZU-KUSSEI 1-like [Erigeron canadensis]
MRTTMIDLGRERGPLGMHIITTATSVDCNSREVGLRRSLRSLIDCIVPACCGAGFEPHSEDSNISPVSSSSSSAFSSDTDSPSSSSLSINNRSLSSSSTTLKGTFFGQRNGRVSFCLQDDNHYHRRTPSRRMTNTTTPTATLSSFTHPLLLLEFAVPTSYLAKEMQHGLLRIALVEEDSTQRQQPPTNGATRGIFEVPVWSMYCNGRKVGYATRRKTTAADSATLTRMQSVSVGAGVLPSENNDNIITDGIMYLRASFRRIIGSPNSESFHMINPDQDGRSFTNSHSGGQELSIFLLRSSS